MAISGRRLTCALLTCAALAFMVPSADAQSTRQERDRVRERQAEVASQVDVLRAEDAEVEAALEALNADVAAQESLLAEARRAVARAEGQVAAARAAEDRVRGRIAVVEGDIRDLAVEAYIGGQPDSTEVMFESDDATDAARRSMFVDLVFGDVADLQDELRSARQDLEAARRSAEEAAAAAETHGAEVATRLDEVSTARDRQAGFAAELDDRIESRLSEAAGLAQLDQQLSAEITRQQAALASRNQSGGGTRRGVSTPAGPVNLRTVRGIVVNEAIADGLDALLAAAEADGIVLSGGGYRDPAAQQAVREANCPDPVNSPASACRPPTARPGHSMHELGLAIDFTYQGRIISSRSSPAYRWLAANAAGYGLYNLPSEPWHWSSNGR